jgi:hypothetical protein
VLNKEHALDAPDCKTNQIEDYFPEVIQVLEAHQVESANLHFFPAELNVLYQ